MVRHFVRHSVLQVYLRKDFLKISELVLESFKYANIQVSRRSGLEAF